MDDAALMQIPDGIDDRTDDSPRFLLSVYFLLADLLVKFSAREILEHEVDVLIIGEVIKKLDDVGMADIPHDVDLSFQ